MLLGLKHLETNARVSESEVAGPGGGAGTHPTGPKRLQVGVAGTANTGGGGGGGGEAPVVGSHSIRTVLVVNGGSGVVIIRYKYQ